MKIWHGYGSEHSMNLVMIGQFKSSDDAEKTHQLIEQLSEGLKDKIDIGTSRNRFGDDVLDLLRGINCNILSPPELEQFLYDTHTQVEGDKIILETEESDVSAFLKLMITKGAKIEIYSAHDYPDVGYGRGK
ncbi:MAG: hypothetical protein KAJ03_00915 [Gammaproteobacteria bacterium]|nr:hypothetical protein [Gammaproteobacteria bacterium]